MIIVITILEIFVTPTCNLLTYGFLRCVVQNSKFSCAKRIIIIE